MTCVTTNHPSPNCEERHSGPVDMLVLHYTGMWRAEDALQRLCDPAAKVSAHYLIDEEGHAFALVPEDKRAWHAGVACWAGETDVNSRSIGIELANRGHDLGYQDFPEPQMATLIELTRGVLARHQIPPARVLGHSDVAPARKLDPGEKFDWARLAREGIGLYPPEGLPKPETAPARETFIRDLARFGYATGETVAEENAVVTAFRRHFHAHALDNDGIGTGDAARLNWLLTRLDAT